jgi:hypothetical protein
MGAQAVADPLDALAAQHGATLATAPPVASIDPLDALASEHGALPVFRATNEKDDQGNAVVRGASKAWNALNTPLLPEIADAAHAIAAHIDAPALDRSRTVAQIRGFLAGATEGAGNVAAGFTSPVGLALTLAGLSGDSAIIRSVPALKALLSLREVQALQRAVQATGGAGFMAHGASRVVDRNATIPERLSGVAEIASGALGATSALRPRGTTAAAPRLSPEEAASNDFARANDVPIDAATATGSGVVRGAQKMVEHTLGGSRVAEHFRTNQEEALARAGGALADQVSPGPTHATEAAAGVRAAVEAKIGDLRSQQNYHYEHLRSLEQAKGGIDVDVATAKQGLRSTYESLLRESQLAPLQGGKARALVALDRFMSGPDVVPLSTADAALGDFKALSRTGDLVQLRTPGQAIAAKAVSQLEAQVSGAAFGAGGSVKQALDAGRAATRQKYATADVLDMLTKGSDEPRAIFNRLTSSRDASINRLRAIQQTVPDQVPHVGRALLEEMLDAATERGRFDHADKLYADWQKLGPLTKATLFPDAKLRQGLDSFFLLAKRISANPNPSGTAHVAGIGAQGALFLTNPLVALKVQAGSYGLAKLLYTKAGVNALTKVLARMPVRASAAQLRAAAQTAGWAEVVSAAKAAGVPMQTPVMADQDEGKP